jgi:hypothetical protein
MASEEKPTRRELFIDRFVATFLASYAAQNYVDWCSLNQHDRFRNQPVEDAVDIAEMAWISLNTKEKS